MLRRKLSPSPGAMTSFSPFSSASTPSETSVPLTSAARPSVADASSMREAFGSPSSATGADGAYVTPRPIPAAGGGVPGASG